MLKIGQPTHNTRAYTHLCQLISKKSGRVLVCECNEYPSTKHRHRWTIHAEEQAIDKLMGLLRARIISLKEISKGVHLFSYRQTKTGIRGMAKPCYRCMQNIRKNAYLIRTIQWTDFDGVVQPEIRVSDLNLSDFQRSGGDPRNSKKQLKN